MKSWIKLACIMFIVSFGIMNLQGQSVELKKKDKKAVIKTLSTMIVENYVSEEVGIKTKEHLYSLEKSGKFKNIKTNKEFAVALTTAVQEINQDKHMRIKERQQYEAPVMTPERLIEEKLHRNERVKSYNGGFHTVKVLEGNVGYLDLRGFAYFGMGKSFADAYMKLLANSDAIIIDLSKNGGGDPDMVRYLCSFFLENDVHINSLYFREGDRTIDFITGDVDGKKMVDIPLFVLTSKKTFSGAEEFSYNMQTQKRATLIGQTTGGGANPGGTVPINENLEVFIPRGKAINPITKTNWEGVGVVPEIETSSEETLDKAVELATQAAEKYRIKKHKEHTNYLMELNKTIALKDHSHDAVLSKLKTCINAQLLNEWEINDLAYMYLNDFKNQDAAMSLLKCNNELYPDYINGYDSYAEVLMLNGELEKAKTYYMKAVELAEKHGDPQIDLYKENLEKLEKKMK